MEEEMCERCENVKLMQRLNERFEWSERASERAVCETSSKVQANMKIEAKTEDCRLWKTE